MRVQAVFLVFLATGLGAPLVAAAQEPVTSFDQLNTRLKIGDTIYVTDAQGREIKGKIRELTLSAMMLDRDGSTTMKADDVRLVTQRKGHPIGKGALWGLGLGAAAGAVIGLTYDDDCSDCWSTGGVAAALAGIFGGMGAGAGAIAGALVPGKEVVVYRAPGASASARLSFAPVITPRSKGLAVSFAF